MIVYLDKKIAADEELVFLERVRKGSASKEESKKFGTLALITDLGESAEKIYEMYKRRKD